MLVIWKSSIFPGLWETQFLGLVCFLDYSYYKTLCKSFLKNIIKSNYLKALGITTQLVGWKLYLGMGSYVSPHITKPLKRGLQVWLDWLRWNIQFKYSKSFDTLIEKMSVNDVLYSLQLYYIGLNLTFEKLDFHVEYF